MGLDEVSDLEAKLVRRGFLGEATTHGGKIRARSDGAKFGNVSPFGFAFHVRRRVGHRIGEKENAESEICKRFGDLLDGRINRSMTKQWQRPTSWRRSAFRHTERSRPSRQDNNKK